MLVNEKEYRNWYGRGISAATLVLYLALAALGAGILKILFSKRGKVTFAGVSLQWGN